MRQETRRIAGVEVTLSWPDEDDDNKVQDVTFLLPGSMVQISEYNGLRDVLLGMKHLVVSFFINVIWPPWDLDKHQTYARAVKTVFDELLLSQHNNSKEFPSEYTVVGHSVGGKIALLLASGIDRDRVKAVLALDPVDMNPVRFTNKNGDNLPLDGTGEKGSRDSSKVLGGVVQDQVGESDPQPRRHIPIVLTCTDGGLGIQNSHNADAIHKYHPTTRFHRHEHAGHMAYCDHGGGLAGMLMPDVGTKEGNAAARTAAKTLVREVLL